jgi:hypothetical protein
MGFDERENGEGVASLWLGRFLLPAHLRMAGLKTI